jgi:hypothetical protein
MFYFYQYITVFAVDFARIGGFGDMISDDVGGQFRRVIGYEGGRDAQQGCVGVHPGVEDGRAGKEFRLGSGKYVITHSVLLLVI